jgi:hypothetical protein
LFNQYTKIQQPKSPRPVITIQLASPCQKKPVLFRPVSPKPILHSSQQLAPSKKMKRSMSLAQLKKNDFSLDLLSKKQGRPQTSVSNSGSPLQKKIEVRQKRKQPSQQVQKQTAKSKSTLSRNPSPQNLD